MTHPTNVRGCTSLGQTFCRKFGSLSRSGVLAAFAFCLSPLAFEGCAGTGSYVWVSDVAEADLVSSQPLGVGIGDNLSVRVFGQDPISVREIVRLDGSITVPLIGQVRVAGRQPVEISDEVAKRLQPFVNDPRVITVIEESHMRIVVAGEVRHPGTLVIDGPTDVLSALANAGGLTEFAAETGIYVLRPGPTGTLRIRFRWDDVSRGVGNSARFQLRNNDQLVVE